MEFLETAFIKILDMGVTASYVIAAIWVVRLLLKKAPKAFSYALWSIAAFRLVCPVSFTSKFSIFNVSALFTPQNAVNMPVSSPTGANFPATTQMPVPSALLPSAAAPSGAQWTAGTDAVQIVTAAAACVWCAGILAMLVYSVISYLKVRQAVRRAVRFEGNVFECEGAASPFVLGMIRPKIYIPFRMSETEKICILCHERHHIRRLDHVVKPLAFIILSVYWFHPLVWLAYLCMIRDMEMSCDERAVSLIGSKRDYSLSLLSVGAHLRFSAAGPLFFGESAVKVRVKNVLGYKKPKAWLLALALLLCVAAAVACSADKPAAQSAATEGTVTPKPQISAHVVEPPPEDESIEGIYEFGDNVYVNPLGSFIAAKGYMPYFEITADKLRIIDPQNDTVEEIGGKAALLDVSQEDFNALFEKEIVLDGFSVPDIAAYSVCSQYAVYKDTYAEYRVYLMDAEVWLAKLSNGHMWSIYRLLKTRGMSVGIIGGADGPADVYVTRSAATLDMCQNGRTAGRVYIEDSQSLSVVQDIIAYYESAKEYRPGADMAAQREYVCLTGLDGKIYYVFDDGTEPCMQTMTYGDSLISLPQQYDEAVQTLWESHKDTAG